MIALIYPDGPGAKVAGPSQEAAAAVASTAKTLREECLRHLRNSDLTADECARKMRLTELSVRPRFSELRKMGLIFDAGTRRKNVSGHTATVWTVNKPQSS